MHRNGWPTQAGHPFHVNKLAAALVAAADTLHRAVVALDRHGAAIHADIPLAIDAALAHDGSIVVAIVAVARRPAQRTPHPRRHPPAIAGGGHNKPASSAAGPK